MMCKKITLKKQERGDSYEAGPEGVICGPTVTVMCSTGTIKWVFKGFIAVFPILVLSAIN